MALDKYGYRQYLREKGFKDDDITYDQDSQTVMANGKRFGNATPEADGSTYNTRGNLDSMYKAYQTQNMPSYKDRTDTLLNKAEERLGQPAKQFQYNAQADPLYQNALQAAQTGAATQQGNTLARLRSMGQGKSSYSEGVASQIGQQAVADVNSKVLPQLTSQAYQRYVDEQQAGRQNFNDTLQLAGTYNNLGQQETDNAYRQGTFDYGKQTDQRNFDYQAGRDQVGDTRYDQQFQYGQQQDALKNDQWNQQFQYGQQMDAAKMAQQAQQFAASQGIDWARLNQQQQQFVSDQAMKQQQLAEQNNPNSLENQYKKAQIDSMKAKTPPEASGIDEYDLLQVEGLANQAGITPQKANPEQIKSFIADLKGKYGWSLDEAKGVESYLNSKKQAYDQEQAAAKAAEKPKKFGYRPFGG